MSPGGRGERSMVPKERPRSYHGRPVIKQSAWTWQVPWYLFTGGLAGASSMLACTASLAGNRALARRSWLIAFAGVGVSPMLLVADLGRPERFLKMMRVLKVTSPMSVGSWLLAANGAVVTPAAFGALRARPPKSARVAEPLAAILGLPLVTYTGVLISSSVIPVWSEARRELPFLFAASGAASAGAAAALATPPQHAAPARRLAIAGAIAEIGVAELMERRLGSVGRPYREGRAKRFGRAAKALTAAGGVLLAGSAGRRTRVVPGAGMILAGAICERWSVFTAGFASAEDPAYTVEPQRARIEERAGAQ